MNVPETPSVVKDIVDNAAERELWITGRLFEHAPYYHAGKGGDTRLAEGLRMCLEDKITPQSDGSYQVQGSGGRVYRVAESCSCPASQRAKSRWCKHAVGVAVYVEWQRRLRPAAPVALGTLRPGTLPLPPTAVDERLARSPQEDRMPDEPQVRITVDGVDYPPPTPQEDPMSDDESIHAPDDQHAPGAIVEPPVPTPAPGSGPGQALRPRPPQVDDLETALQVWTTERAVVQRFLKQELKANIDYYTLRIGGKDSKPSLSKAGAEKVLGWLRWSASFVPDTGTWEMLGRPQDLVVYVCTLRTRSGEIVGEGRGARSIKKDNGDVNKAIKMAEKSSCVSAVLRTGALSDVFTSDLEDMQEPEPAKPSATPPKPTGTEYRQRIWTLVQAQAPDANTREAVEAYIQRQTGYALHPDNYPDILEALSV